MQVTYQIIPSQHSAQGFTVIVNREYKSPLANKPTPPKGHYKRTTKLNRLFKGWRA